MKVLKFGGSSVANATNMSRVIDIVSEAALNDSVVLISSAISGCTDKLIEIGSTQDKLLRKELTESLKKRHHDIVKRLFTGAEREATDKELDEEFDRLEEAPSDTCVTFGELFSTKILARKIACEGLVAKWIDSRELIITKNGIVDEELSGRLIREAVSGPEKVFVAPGFIASDENGKVTTLGRGGSDYSAALFAAALKAADLQIWTDVPGIMTTNPKDVPSARTIDNISYEAALTLASYGAKVLYAPTVKPAMEASIGINIRNTFDPQNPGTMISGLAKKQHAEWKGVTGMKIQNSDESLICLVAENLQTREASQARIESTLQEAGILPTSEVTGEGGVFFIKVRSLVEKATIAALHREFFEIRSISTINVFIAGHGAVSHSLIEMIDRSKEKIAKGKGRSIRIVGLADSRKYIIDLKGIEPDLASLRMEEDAVPASSEAFVNEILRVAPKGSVFIDCTNSHELYQSYEPLFRKGVNVVTSNRRSLAVPYAQYAALKASAHENGVFFRYDTTVGTALPILESIASEANCSDEFVSIDAVLSCTMNNIITGYDGENRETFATLLRRAQDQGLTEHDPRTDLGGKDAMRKLLILAREAGIHLEEDDVRITPMLGPEFFNCGIDEFYELLAANEPQFIAREQELDELGKRQRFIASIRKDSSEKSGFKADIKMRLVGEDSPFYWISGTENVTIIRSKLSAPLVIKGAGEGARLAAIGIIKDILM